MGKGKVNLFQTSRWLMIALLAMSVLVVTPESQAQVYASANFDLGQMISNLFGFGSNTGGYAPGYQTSPQYEVPAYEDDVYESGYTRPRRARRYKRSRSVAPPLAAREINEREAEGQPPCLTCGNGYSGRRSQRAVKDNSRLHIRVAAREPVGSSGWLPHAARIQAAINSGAGLSAPWGYCGRAVWRILLRAGLVRGSWNSAGADAKYMGPILRRNGFVNDRSACNRPGVVRIYDGNRSGVHFRNRMAGDRVGHIEVLGTDRRFHHFISSNENISQNMQRRFGYASRRPLMQCWYKP